MKKNYLLLFILACFVLSGCSAAETTQTSIESDSVQRTTESYTSISEDNSVESSIEASISEEESAAEELAKYDAVSDKLIEKINSEEYANADDETKAEAIIEVLKDLSVNGTDEYPYSLVLADSWEYLPEEREVVFKFYNGIESGFVLYNENDPYTPDQTDTTQE